MTPGKPTSDWWLNGPVEWLGLRRTITLTFALASLVMAVLLSAGTYFVARDVLLDQRETAVLAQAYAQAAVIREGLRGVNRSPGQVLGDVAPPPGSSALIYRSGAWYSTSLQHGAGSVPAPVKGSVAGGTAIISWSENSEGPCLVVGIPLQTVDAQFFVVNSTSDLDRTLDALARVSAVATLLAVAAAALLGRWVAGRVMGPLDRVASATATIAGGDLKTRLPATTDPELATITTSFNAMVDALEKRIERDARFSADVSHELRSPLTTLTTSVQLLQGRREELPERAQRALDLMSVELARFRSVLEGLLELGRLEAGVSGTQRQFADLGELVHKSLLSSGRLDVPFEGLAEPGFVRVDKRQIDRVLVNLFDNADIHGGGVALVRLSRAEDGSQVRVHVHDRGEGVDLKDRERIFERFARGAHSRGSRPGSGLGLSLVAEMLRAHGGAVEVGDSPLGGAEFVMTLPVSEPDADAPGPVDAHDAQALT